MGKGTRDFAFAAAMLPSTAVGSPAKRLTAAHLCDVFRLKRLYCEPNAFNVAPNRTLQRADFRYVCSREGRPNPINSYQTTTIWVYVPVDGSPGTVHAAAQR
jgi:RimJ/RimL family protein N-acetyltransferase